jgi:hypothetical protein
MMSVLVVHCADSVLMLYSCLFAVGIKLVWGCCLERGLIFFLTTIQTELALGAEAVAVAKVSLGCG